MEQPIHSHYVEIGAHSNSGEALMLRTEWFSNGDEDGGLFMNQQITLHSYSNSASFSLGSKILDPGTLRWLADQIEDEELKASKLLRTAKKN